MAKRRNGAVSQAILEEGARIQASCKLLDCADFQDHLSAFGTIQAACVDAQAAVDAAVGNLTAAQVPVAEHDLDVREQLELLVRSLVMDGAPLRNPLDGLSASKTEILRLNNTDRAAAMRQLSAAVLRSKTFSKVTKQAAQAADEAAQQVQKAAQPIAALEAAVREARHARDALAEPWENKRASLRRRVRYLDQDGRPGLYGSVFTVAEPAKKKAKAAAAKPAPDSAAA